MYHAGTTLKPDILLASVLFFFQEDTLHICVELTEPLFLFFGRRDPSSVQEHKGELQICLLYHAILSPCHFINLHSSCSKTNISQ